MPRFRCVLAATSLAGRSTSVTRFPSSTPTPRRVETSSTALTPTRSGSMATAAASPRGSSAAGCRPAATADQMIVATKVGALTGVTAEQIRAGAHTSLERMQTDRIDLYYAHRDDPRSRSRRRSAPLIQLVGDGRGPRARRLRLRRRAPGLRAGDFRARRIRPPIACFSLSTTCSNATTYEGALQDECQADGIACVPFYVARAWIPDR